MPASAQSCWRLCLGSGSKGGRMLCSSHLRLDDVSGQPSHIRGGISSCVACTVQADDAQTAGRSVGDLC